MHVLLLSIKHRQMSNVIPWNSFFIWLNYSIKGHFLRISLAELALGWDSSTIQPDGRSLHQKNTPTCTVGLKKNSLSHAKNRKSSTETRQSFKDRRYTNAHIMEHSQICRVHTCNNIYLIYCSAMLYFLKYYIGLTFLRCYFTSFDSYVQFVKESEAESSA